MAKEVIVQTFEKAEDGIESDAEFHVGKFKILQNSKFLWRAQLLKCYLIKYLKSKPFYIFDHHSTRCTAKARFVCRSVDIM